MSYNYLEPGHTPIVLRGEYAQFHGAVEPWSLWRLLSVNETTGWARLRCVAHVSQPARLVSLSVLTHWRLVNRPVGV